MERYSRQIMLPDIGVEGQKRIGASAVLIVGLGGLGCPVSLYLAGAGVGRIGLCDADTVSLSNLQRQTLYRAADVGRPKTEAAAERLAALSPTTRYDLWPQGLRADNAAEIIVCYDMVIDCCDNYATRYLIDDTCRALERTWVYGSINEFSGQICVFSPHGPGYSDLYTDREFLETRSAAGAGVLGAVPGVAGALQATEALKWLTGMPVNTGRILTFDLRTMQFDLFTL